MAAIGMRRETLHDPCHGGHSGNRKNRQAGICPACLFLMSGRTTFASDVEDRIDRRLSVISFLAPAIPQQEIDIVEFPRSVKRGAFELRDMI
jgi:hypothetical protein